MRRGTPCFIRGDGRPCLQLFSGNLPRIREVEELFERDRFAVIRIERIS